MSGVTSNSSDLGTVIRARRMLLGLRVEDVAASSGVAYRTIIRVEAGFDPQMGTLRRLAAALDTTPAELLRAA